MVEIPEQAAQAAASVLSKISKRETYHLDNLKDDMNILTAAAPYMSGVKVKQLEWGELNEGKTFRALLPIIGSIRVEPYGVCGWWEVLWSMPGQCDKLVPDVFDTPEEAKAAAQADFEERIQSALEPSSAREQALEEAEKLCTEYARSYQKGLRHYGSADKDKWRIAQEAHIDAGNELADAIRALKSQPPQTGGGDE